MKKSLRALMFVAVVIAPSNIHLALAAEVRRPPEWEKIVEAAKKEGKIVLAIPPAAELAKKWKVRLSEKLGLEAELVPIRSQERKPDRGGAEGGSALFRCADCRHGYCGVSRT